MIKFTNNYTMKLSTLFLYMFNISLLVIFLFFSFIYIKQKQNIDIQLFNKNIIYQQKITKDNIEYLSRKIAIIKKDLKGFSNIKSPIDKYLNKNNSIYFDVIDLKIKKIKEKIVRGNNKKKILIVIKYSNKSKLSSKFLSRLYVFDIFKNLGYKFISEDRIQNRIVFEKDIK